MSNATGQNTVSQQAKIEKLLKQCSSLKARLVVAERDADAYAEQMRGLENDIYAAADERDAQLKTLEAAYDDIATLRGENEHLNDLVIKREVEIARLKEEELTPIAYSAALDVLKAENLRLWELISTLNDDVISRLESLDQ